MTLKRVAPRNTLCDIARVRRNVQENMINAEPLLGVLGGMGPLATADFLRELTLLTPAARDQDHFRVIVYSNPLIPDRSLAILGQGESPLPALLDGLRFLERNGVGAIAIPCNACHYWIDELKAAARVAIIDITEAVRDELSRLGAPRAVGVLAARGTIQAGVYRRRLLAAGFEVIEPNGEDEEFGYRGIAAVKAGDLDQGRACARRAVAALEARGARAIVLGCTEFPVALAELQSAAGSPLINSTKAQARACVAWALARRRGGADEAELIEGETR
jgi:aspartate racemase